MVTHGLFLLSSAKATDRGASMGRNTVVTYTDDVTGETVSPDSLRTVRIIVGKSWYELEVSGGTFRKLIEPLTESGRKIPNPNGNVVPMHPTATKPPVKATIPDRAQRVAVRLWWRQNQAHGELPSYSERGRIPVVVSEAFQTHEGRPIPEPVQEPKAPAKRTRKPVAAAGRSPRKQGTRTA